MKSGNPRFESIDTNLPRRGCTFPEAALCNPYRVAAIERNDVPGVSRRCGIPQAVESNAFGVFPDVWSFGFRRMCRYLCLAKGGRRPLLRCLRNSKICKEGEVNRQ